jgi:hypothetical protein
MNRNNMTNLEANDKAATVAEQGAHVAPEKAPSKKGARQKKGKPKAKKSAKSHQIPGISHELTVPVLLRATRCQNTWPQ